MVNLDRFTYYIKNPKNSEKYKQSTRFRNGLYLGHTKKSIFKTPSKCILCTMYLPKGIEEKTDQKGNAFFRLLPSSFQIHVILDRLNIG